MTMRSPIIAMLWENWRLTRAEAAWHLALGIVAASAVLVALAAVAAVAGNEAAKDRWAVMALIVVFVPHVIGWFSVNKLMVERAGFPFHLLYTRPVRTAVAVGIPMAYLAALPAASYLVSALLLRITSGHAFPLLPAAAWITALNLTSWAVNWSIRNVAVRTLAHLAASVAWSAAPIYLLNEEIPGPGFAPLHLWPTVFDLPLTCYALIGAIGLASYGLTVAAVARQRRGDGRAAISWIPGSGFPDRLVSLFRFPCPISSATRAQVWFELRSRGLPLLAIGAALAIVNPLLFAVSGPIDAALYDGVRQYVPCADSGCFYARALAMLFAILSVVTVLGLGGNAFGIRWRPGHRYASAFEATQAYGTARLAGLKVLVRSVCQLAAIFAVGVSVWASQSFIAVDKGYAPLVEIADEPLENWQRAIEGAVGALTGYEKLALAAVAFTGVAIWVASWAALGALATRYPRRVNTASSLLLLHGLALVLLALAGQRGIGPEFLLPAMLRATKWLAVAAIVLATVYLVSSSFAERLLTLGQASGAVLVSAAFGATWVIVLRAAGVQLSGMPAMDVVWMLSPALLPLMTSVLAPWSFSRARHT
ncbi:MAG TPA: hypothetical protein VFO67_10680 [Gemmatimonadales bacterium]|nr:hypothetical protein [Gemmatimonadales bacterium]